MKILQRIFSLNIRMKSWLHTGRTQVSIFTAVAYFRETKEGAIEHASFAVNSDEMSHDKSTIYKLKILPSIFLKKVTIMKVHY